MAINLSPSGGIDDAWRTRVPQGWIQFPDGSFGPPNQVGSDWNAPYRGTPPSGAPTPSGGTSIQIGGGGKPIQINDPTGVSGGNIGGPGGTTINTNPEPEIIPPSSRPIPPNKQVGRWTNPFTDGPVLDLNAKPSSPPWWMRNWNSPFALGYGLSGLISAGLENEAQPGNVPAHGTGPDDSGGVVPLSPEEIYRRQSGVGIGQGPFAGRPAPAADIGAGIGQGPFAGRPAPAADIGVGTGQGPFAGRPAPVTAGGGKGGKGGGRINPGSVNLGRGIPGTATAQVPNTSPFIGIERQNAPATQGQPGRGYQTALDLSGLFGHPAVAAAAAAHPAVQAHVAGALASRRLISPTTGQPMPMSSAEAARPLARQPSIQNTPVRVERFPSVREAGDTSLGQRLTNDPNVKRYRM